MNAIERVVTLSLAALALIPATVLAQAGYVHETAGPVRMYNGDVAGVAVKAGDTFVRGARFETSASGRAVLKFEDGQLVALHPDTTFRIAHYAYDPRNPRVSGANLSLEKGALRLVTGLIGATNVEALHVAAGAFIVFLRGTDVSLLATRAAKPTQTAAVNLGGVILQTGSGSVRVSNGQFASMTTGQLPNLAAPISVAPAAVRATINSLAAISLPDNRPVVIGSAARAVAAEARAQDAAAAAAANPTDEKLGNAAAAARAEADAANRAAANQAAAAYKAAILAGYFPPTPPAFTSPTQQAAAPVRPELTVPHLGCTGSPC